VSCLPSQRDMNKRKITTTFSSKGQLTVPKYIRDRLKVKSGDKVEIEYLADVDGFIGRLKK
jgi:AbrB family looped-hinge helix DNA binding protein